MFREKYTGKINKISELSTIEYSFNYVGKFKDSREIGNDNKLDVYISTIRKKLDKDFIQTVKGMGYRIGM
jgi:hypothetical protein